jgi:hypothetical protein
VGRGKGRGRDLLVAYLSVVSSQKNQSIYGSKDFGDFVQTKKKACL